MVDFFFFVKTFILTVAIVLAMQIQVGDKSIETHTLSFVHSSYVVMPLNSAAQGGAKLIRDLSSYVSGKVRRNTKKNAKKEEKKSSSSFRWIGEARQAADEAEKNPEN
jgi:hypothetical protein